jgi:hypothetical protein
MPYTRLLSHEVALGAEEIQKVGETGGLDERLGSNTPEGISEPDEEKLYCLKPGQLQGNCPLF